MRVTSPAINFLSAALTGLYLAVGGLSSSIHPAFATPAPEREQKPQQPQASLDELFVRLRETNDAAEAKGVATLIEHRLARSGSATADLLTDRARVAMSATDIPLAIELMDRALALEPTWSEGWNRRATLFWRLSDSPTAIADLQRALVLEPRHYEAWAALGKLYLAAEDKQRALDAFRRAQVIYPQWDMLKKAIEKLSPDVDGRDL